VFIVTDGRKGLCKRGLPPAENTASDPVNIITLSSASASKAAIRQMIPSLGFQANHRRADLRPSSAARQDMRKSRKMRIAVDHSLYSLRNLVERRFNKLKKARLVTTPYDKTAERFLGFIYITSVRLCVRLLST
jgi:transposase